MGKLIIDTSDTTYYYCGGCAKKISYNSIKCLNCDHHFDSEKHFRLPITFDPSTSILEQLALFEEAEIINGLSHVNTTKKLQINSEGVSFFYCKNCRTGVNRTELQCPKCNHLFSDIINVDSSTDNILQRSDTVKVEDTWEEQPVTDFQAPVTEARDDFQQADEMEYVGFWKRVGAYLIDFLILNIISLFVGSFLSIFVFWFYFAGWESSEKQATPGKMVIKSKVVDNDGQRISFGRATGRHFSRILSGMIFGIGLLMVAFDAKKKGLHDHIVKTYVIKA